jgi:hypothetical protein
MVDLPGRMKQLLRRFTIDIDTDVVNPSRRMARAPA